MTRGVCVGDQAMSVWLRQVLERWAVFQWYAVSCNVHACLEG